MYRFSNMLDNKCPRSLIISIVCFLLFFSSSCVDAHAEFFKDHIKYLTSISGDGQDIKIKKPRDVYVDDHDDIYLLDSSLKKILVYNKKFVYVSTIDIKNDSALTQCLCVDHNGYIYLSKIIDRVSMRFGKLEKFNTLGKLVEETEFKEYKSFQGKGLKDFAALDMAIDEHNNLYLAGGKHGLIILDNQKNIIKQIIPQDNKIDPKTKNKTKIFPTINHVTIDSQDRIYLLSKDQRRCYVFNNNGEFVFKFGKLSGTSGGFSFPYGLAVDERHKQILVMDYMRHTLSFFSKENGSYLGEYGGKGTSAGWFFYPGSICLNKENNRLFVADILNKRFQVFEITG